jgi:hypothetical protein
MFWMPEQVRHDEIGLFTNSSIFSFEKNIYHPEYAIFLGGLIK